MKILIVGYKGQLGTELIKILKKGCSELGEIPAVFDCAEVQPVGIDGLDITDAQAVEEYLAQARPDVVVNCAAFTNVDGCETQEEAAYLVNAVGPGNLARSCEGIGAKLVHISTDYVFDGSGSRPYTEEDMPSPVSAYGRTKLAGERFVQENCGKYFIIRTAWLYGYTGKNFVRTMLKLGRERGAVTVVNDQLGSPTHANDLAHHILKLAATEKYGVYHCTGKGECTWYEFAKEIMAQGKVEATVSPCTSEQFPTPTKRPAYSVLSHEKLDAAVGDEMRYWQDALRSFFEHDK